MSSKLSLALRIIFGFLPYLVYTYYLKRINVFFEETFNIDEGINVGAYMAFIKASNFFRMLLFNEGLIFFAVWLLYGKLKSFIYLKFSIVFISTAMFLKALTYLTKNDLIQKIAYSMGLLGSNIEWFLLIVASFYIIKTKTE